MLKRTFEGSTCTVRDDRHSRRWRQRADDAPVRRALILITGDECGLPPGLQLVLNREGCDVVLANTPRRSANAGDVRPDLVIINVADLRSSKAPAVQEMRDRYRRPVVCLVPHPTPEEARWVGTLGADEILYKPLSDSELRSRMRVLLWGLRAENSWPVVERRRFLRRAEDRGEASANEPPRRPAIQINERERLVYRDGEAVHVTPKEYALLSLLASDPGRVFSNREILSALWPHDRRAAVNELHQYVYALRRKLEPEPSEPRYIVTVPFFGYRLLI